MSDVAELLPQHERDAAEILRLDVALAEARGGIGLREAIRVLRDALDAALAGA